MVHLPGLSSWMMFVVLGSLSRITLQSDGAITVMTKSHNDKSVPLKEKGFMLNGNTNLTFKVRATNDAHIMLGMTCLPNETEAYQIVIGGWSNKKSVIRKCKGCLPKDQYDHVPLSDEEFRSFWISWTGGLIQVGNGSRPPDGMFMSWQDDSPRDVKCIAISTGWGANGTWMFNSTDGGWSSWTEWSACNESCGQGVKRRQRACDDPPPFNGEPCSGLAEETRTCLVKHCPVDGNWTAWQEWGACSLTCGNGSRSRTRSCDNPSPQHEGKNCSGQANETEQCFERYCPVNGGWSTWGEWSACSVSCASGSRSRARQCNNPAANYNGTPCTGPDLESESCFIRHCPVDGGWSSWSNWTRCSEYCGEGTHMRFRKCDNPKPAHYGEYCPGEQLEEGVCQQRPCPIDGSWRQWSGWSTCSATCNGGTRKRLRNCTDPAPLHGGQFCPGPESEYKDCFIKHCAVDGAWSAWTYWTICSATCGGGINFRHRTCTSPAPAHGGAPCEGLDKENDTCNDEPCTGVRVVRALRDEDTVEAPGAVGIGVIGLVLMCTLLGLLLLMDISTVSKQLKILKRNVMACSRCDCKRQRKRKSYMAHAPSSSGVNHISNRTMPNNHRVPNQDRPVKKKDSFENLYDVMEFHYRSLDMQENETPAVGPKNSRNRNLTSRWGENGPKTTNHRRIYTKMYTGLPLNMSSLKRYSTTKV